MLSTRDVEEARELGSRVEIDVAVIGVLAHGQSAGLGDELRALQPNMRIVGIPDGSRLSLDDLRKRVASPASM